MKGKKWSYGLVRGRKKYFQKTGRGGGLIPNLEVTKKRGGGMVVLINYTNYGKGWCWFTKIKNILT